MSGPRSNVTEHSQIRAAKLRENPASGLEQWQFTRIAMNGFGDPLNAYAHTMAWFKDHLYIGTMRANLCLLKGRLPLPVTNWPVKCPESVFELDMRAQIWRYDPRGQEWEPVHVSPLLTGEGGEQVPREISYRGMTVFQGPDDPGPALYVTTWGVPQKGQGPVVLRSVDGKGFVPVSEPGLGDSTVSAFRSLVSFNGCLYTAPTGRSGGKPNTPDNPVILESSRPANGVWRLACTPGFGDPTNLTVFEMIPFNGFLYAGTLNPTGGYQIWKTQANDRPPYRWVEVISKGAYRGPLNETVVSMRVFGDALYVGGGIQNGGYDRTHNIGPAAAELIRIHPDDSWDLIVGEARSTPQGFKRPLSGFGPGFENITNGYFWRMAEFDGFLYVGTFNWTALLPYLQPIKPGHIGDRIGRWFGIDNLVQFDAGFDLYRSQDGVQWCPVTTTGFGNPYNYGVRTMVGTPYGLFVGTANPFGPEVAVRTPNGWVYAPNPRGGAEVWLGTIRNWGCGSGNSSCPQHSTGA
jgi:hypothetical protein